MRKTKDNRWSPTHFSSIRRAWVSESEKFEKIFQSPYGVGTVPGAKGIVRNDGRVDLEPVRRKKKKFIFFRSPMPSPVVVGGRATRVPASVDRESATEKKNFFFFQSPRFER